MKYYLDITLLPDADITLSFIWQKVYQQVHIALVDNKVRENESAVALAFPRYGDKAFPLGNQLRLLAETQEQLSKLNIQRWLNRLQDYVHIKPIKVVPGSVTQVCFVRQHVKGQARIKKNMQYKAQYWAEKSGQSIEACLLTLEKSKPQGESALPVIWLESQESKKRNANAKFPLFIKKVEVEGKQKGTLNCYGLSVSHKSVEELTSIPHF